MQFQVPQFIEVEDRIVGPLTFKQFIYLVGGAGASYVFWRILPIYFSIPLIIIVVSIAVALAFIRMNDRPFNTTLENGFYFLIHSKLYLWNNERKPLTMREASLKSTTNKGLYIPKLSNSKLHELAWSLDIQERIASGTTIPSERPNIDALAPIRTARDAMSQ